jgi:adenylate kinase family enzyme
MCGQFDRKTFKNLNGKCDFCHPRRKISLEIFGKRIMIFGPSASGKSEMADALGRKMNIPIYHLDKLCFLPNTFWVPRPVEEFQKLHEAAVNLNEWIIDGNYSALMARRIARATAVIWLDPPAMGCIFRFYKRFFRKHRRQNQYIGLLDGADEKFTFTAVRYIFRHKMKRQFFLKLIESFPAEKVFHMNSFEMIKDFCEKIRA